VPKTEYTGRATRQPIEAKSGHKENDLLREMGWLGDGRSMMIKALIISMSYVLKERGSTTGPPLSQMALVTRLLGLGYYATKPHETIMVERLTLVM
jgi:hypothetical protein